MRINAGRVRASDLGVDDWATFITSSSNILISSSKLPYGANLNISPTGSGPGWDFANDGAWLHLTSLLPGKLYRLRCNSQENWDYKLTDETPDWFHEEKGVSKRTWSPVTRILSSIGKR